MALGLGWAWPCGLGSVLSLHLPAAQSSRFQLQWGKGDGGPRSLLPEASPLSAPGPLLSLGSLAPRLSQATALGPGTSQVGLALEHKAGAWLGHLCPVRIVLGLEVNVLLGPLL